MKTRPIYNGDLPALQAAIDADPFHPKGTWHTEHFRGFSEAVEREGRVVVFVLYIPEENRRLRISTMWTDPENSQGNARAIIFFVRSAALRANEAGFSELIFQTEFEKLADFCTKALGFVSVGNNEYVLELKGGNNVRPV